MSATPFHKHDRLSTLFSSNIWVKRDDLQDVRSFKIRGAFNRISLLLSNITTPHPPIPGFPEHAPSV